MSDFFDGFKLGAFLGFMLTVSFLGLAVSKCSDYATEEVLSGKHCQHIESRAEYAKCREEFLK